jgi:signal peptidase II
MLKKALAVILGVLLIDQGVKFWVKTHMALGTSHPVLGNWFIIHFVENNGMAFGMELAGEYGKLLLSSFRILAVLAIGWYLIDISKKKMHIGLVISVALIFAGAIGNILDSIFYGLIFSGSDYEVATFLPAEGGYAGWLHGRVVDMFYFPIFEGHFPSWFPFWGNEEFIFFRPVFNVADSAITIGVLIIIVFQRKFWPEKKEGAPAAESGDETPPGPTIDPLVQSTGPL